METKRIIKISVLVALLIILGTALLNSLKTIPTGCVGVKTQFGKVQNDLLQEGLNLKIPFVEKIVLMDCKTKKIEVTSESSSKDLQTVSVSVALNYNVNKEQAGYLYRNVGTDYENIIIRPAILESIKSVMAQYTAEELITKRSEVSAMIWEALAAKIMDKGFDVTGFDIIDLNFSEAFNAAIEAKVVKQQEVAAAQAELEKQKIQNEKEVSIAEKDAKVMELQNSQITDKTLKQKELEIKQKMIEKWDGKYPTTMLGNDTSALFNLNK